MIKNIFTLALATTFLSCFEAAAQNQTQAEIGNPGSANMMMVEEGYVVQTAAPQENSDNQTSPNMPDDSATVMEQITGTETPDSLDIEEDETVIQNN